MAISQFPLSPIPIAILLTENGDILVVQTGTPHWTLGYRLLGSLLSLLGSRFYTRMSHTQKLLMSRMVSFFHVGWDTFFIYYITEYFLLTKYFCSLNISARGAHARARTHTHTTHARTHAHWRVRMHPQRKYLKTASSKNSNHNNKITTTTLTTKTAATARKIAATVTVTKKQVSYVWKKRERKRKEKKRLTLPFLHCSVVMVFVEELDSDSLCSQV